MEDLRQYQQQAKEALAAKIEDGKKFKRDFEDSDCWDDLSKQYNIRLPAWWIAPEVGMMKRYLRKLKIRERDFKEACGDGWEFEDFAKLNPTFPLRAFVGNLLEYYDDLQGAKSNLGKIG